MTRKIIEFSSSKGIEFGFDGLDSWQDFDLLVNILTDKFGCKIIEKYDGPYSRFCRFELDGIQFRLINHPEFGNALNALVQDNRNNEFVRLFANKIINYI